MGGRIIITPEMLNAGADAASEYRDRFYETIAREVYTAMERVRSQQRVDKRAVMRVAASSAA